MNVGAYTSRGRLKKGWMDYVKDVTATKQAFFRLLIVWLVMDKVRNIRGSLKVAPVAEKNKRNRLSW